jgi:hypothetical protein
MNITYVYEDDPLFERKIENATAGLKSACKKILKRVSKTNAGIIADYIISMQTEMNPSNDYKKAIIMLRQSIDKYTKNNKLANECLKFMFYSIEEKEICEVVIKPSPRPIFIYDEGGKQQECYVRVGNSSKPYTLDEFYEYSRRRFK